ncbi:MAG: hypothetical protein AB7G11_14635 [Phycisphaerales bacterium]
MTRSPQSRLKPPSAKLNPENNSHAPGYRAALPASQSEPKCSADDVRRRAYEIYLTRQATGRLGSPESDWCEAEKELSR